MTVHITLDEGAQLVLTNYGTGRVMLSTRSPGGVIVTTVHLTADQAAALRAAIHDEEAGDE